MIVTKDEFHQWISHPCTKEFLDYLRTQISDTKEVWAGGGYVTIEENAKAQGSAWALGEVVLAAQDGTFLEEIV